MEKPNGSIHKNYLLDLGTLIKELALAAKKASSAGTSFDTGYLAGFHRVVSLMQQQAEGFGIPLEEIGLEGIDADEDLI